MSGTKNWHKFSHKIRNEGTVIYVLTILIMYIKIKEKHVDTRKRLDLQVLLPLGLRPHLLISSETLKVLLSLQ